MSFQENVGKFSGRQNCFYTHHLKTERKEKEGRRSVETEMGREREKVENSERDSKRKKKKKKEKMSDQSLRGLYDKAASGPEEKDSCYILIKHPAEH